MNRAWFGTQKDSFVVLWTIENLRYVDKQKDTRLRSPVFTMDSTGTRWYIMLHPNDEGAEKVGVYLYRCCDGYNESISLQWIIKIVKEGNVLATRGTISYVFEQNTKSGYGNPSVIKLNKILPAQTEPRYYDDVLILCEMWIAQTDLKLTEIIPDDYHHFESIGQNINLFSDFPSENFDILEDIDQIERRFVHNSNQCSIRTIINAKETELEWTMDRFSELLKKKKKIVFIKPSYSESVAVVISYLDNDDVLQIDVLLNKTLTDYEFAQCHLSVRDKHKGVERSFQKVCYFESGEIRRLSFPDVIKRSDVLAAKEKLLNTDALNLHLMLTFVERPTSTYIIYSTGPTSKVLQPGQENHVSEQMEDIFESRKYCDLTLRAGTQDILCHKAIVCHMSPVLDAMLTADMQEKNTGVVHVPDVDPDTLNTLLRYMYTGEMDDMDVPECLKLYVASDKYQVSSLTRECREMLEENLSVDNVCDVLLCADAHSDVTLKKCSMDFIRSNVSRVFSSDEWRSIAEDNPKLASEVILQMSGRQNE